MSKYGHISAWLLENIADALEMPWPIPYTETWRRKMLSYNRSQVRRAMNHLRDTGYVKVVTKNGKKFLRLTANGQLDLFMKKAGVVTGASWDGKWRMLIFDIPEDAKEKRDHLRWLLKHNNFYKLQASVFISPYPLNREALEYLKLTGLDSYIRIGKIEEMDFDDDLKKYFGI